MRGVTLVVCLLLVTAGCTVDNQGTETATPSTLERVGSTAETPQQPTTPSSRSYDIEVAKLENLIHMKFNERRRQNDLEALTRSERLSAIARYKSWDMAQRDYFGHRGPNGKSHSEFRSEYNSTCQYIGQNIYAYKYDGDRESSQQNIYNLEKLADNAVNSLMNSTGHRENILDPNYELQGIGVFVDENGTVFLTQEFCG